ncbi:MAG: response regulator transcription factor [Saprospiraceae bacterium]|nr:response regulator transcription factor [Saprospiraceae bacterium]
MKSILAIEDDPSLLELLKIHLSDINCQLDTAEDGLEGLKKILENEYDLIILDVMLPSIDGFELCKRIRSERIPTPVLMLTAKSEEIDKILGLEIGADDYVVKPFSIRELIARVKALLRRVNINEHAAENQQSTIIQRGSLEVNVEKRKVTVGDRRIDLSPKEFDLLVLLASNPGVSYNRNRLLNLVWGYDFEGFAHTVNSHINRLRAKIEPNMTEPTYILTTWGIGYRFNEDF